MATLLVCDICGEQDNVLSVTTSFYVKNSRKMSRFGCEPNMYEVDLCENCIKKLEDVFNGHE